jgi:hypothetical protein
MRLARAVVVALALTVTGCDDSPEVAPTVPVTITSDTFTGTVPFLPDTHNGQATHTFFMSTSGTVTLALVSAGPPPTIFMGVNLGIPTGGTCPLSMSAVVQAGLGSLTPGVLAAGPHCVSIYDVGNQTAPVDYVLTVTHPM